jgi:hypothetical protein
MPREAMPLHSLVNIFMPPAPPRKKKERERDEKRKKKKKRRKLDVNTLYIQHYIPIHSPQSSVHDFDYCTMSSTPS